MTIQEMRLARGWSQEDLATLSGLNVRTIQRIEAGKSASTESFKALGAAFNVDFSKLQESTVRQMTQTPEQAEVALAYEQVQYEKGFYKHLAVYVAVNLGLITINLLTAPHRIWFIFPLVFWGAGVAYHRWSVFSEKRLFDGAWERAQVEKKLGRKLSDH